MPRLRSQAFASSITLPQSSRQRCPEPSPRPSPPQASRALPRPIPRALTSTPSKSAAHPALAAANKTLAALIASNALYAADALPHPPSPQALRHDVATNGQHPVATVITCADSRVPPEILFRAQVGSLFVLRTAGNVTSDEAVLASVEFAVAVLKTPLVIVMGHEMCGAIGASIASKRDPGFADTLPHFLASHVKKMAASLPEMSEFEGLGEEAVTTRCVEVHTLVAAEELIERSEVVRESVEKGEALVVSAVYDLSSGLVRTLGCATFSRCIS